MQKHNRSSTRHLGHDMTSGAGFLELSGVGRVAADGANEDEAWARKMDDWIGEEAVRGRRTRLTYPFSLIFLSFLFLRFV
jgi:hypothetical protein